MPLACLAPILMQGRRFSRPKRLNAYKEWLKQFAADAVRLGPQVAGSWMPAESADDRLLDTVMLRLRLGDGLDLRQLAAGHPQGDEASALVLQALKPHVERGWVLVDGGGSSIDSVTTVRLADPHGLVVSNDIISDVFAALDVTQDT
jgi:oxygen-independent coproporphyrinogen-3 oxidase